MQFKPYDCEILEASNGVEGLAIAAKESPQLILLDVTMPVMDGVEMLTKLKADPALKGIPVMMLTAEGGRDNVLKIAKIGVRDYIVKPFVDKCRELGIPVPTVTARDRFALVIPDGMDIRFRMLQPHELAAAMGFPADYQFLGTKSDAIRMIGNAWSVRTAEALCRVVLEQAKPTRKSTRQEAVA